MPECIATFLNKWKMLQLLLALYSSIASLLPATYVYTLISVHPTIYRYTHVPVDCIDLCI